MKMSFLKLFHSRGRQMSLWIAVSIVLLAGNAPVTYAATIQDLDNKISDRSTSFYRDMFDSVLYGQFAQWLRFDHLFDWATFKKHEALDINAFDEVPDSSFFVNRHGRKRLSRDAVKQGPATGSGPDPNGAWRVLKGKSDGVTVGFFIEDEKGVKYLLKFDPKDNLEMATAAEIIGHKFFHAFGYHVPEYYLVRFSPEILTVDPNATYYDDNGFKKPLTREALKKLLSLIPKLKRGMLRASASKLLPSPRKGYMDIDGRRKSDPDDLIVHENRRAIRGLSVFASWLNHYDLRKSNTLDILVSEDGEVYLKHYLIDFGSTLGSAATHPKDPVAGYEHIVDWVEVAETIPHFKLFEDPWEKRWDMMSRTIEYPSLGNFDNYEFDPGKWKTQLPYKAFGRLTAGDAFWATKIIMAFTDDNIKSIVSTAEYSDPQDEALISDILIARRDIIGKYWFSRVTPLDQIRLFDLGSGAFEVRAKDLAVAHGFERIETSSYRYRLTTFGQDNDRRGHAYREVRSPSFPIALTELGNVKEVRLAIQVRRSASGEWSKPPLEVTLAESARDHSLQIVEIDHGV